MANSDETLNVQRSEGQTPFSVPKSLDYTFSKLRDALTRMNLYGDKVLRLHRKLEKSDKTLKLLRYWKGEALDGSVAAPPHRGTAWNQTARLEDRLESRLLQLERLVSQSLEPRRVADAAVQAEKAGRSIPSCCCRRREAWWPEATALLRNACLVAAGVLIGQWFGGAASSVVINIGQQSW